MKTIVEKLEAVVDELESFEATNDMQAWMAREAVILLNRAVGILQTFE